MTAAEMELYSPTEFYSPTAPAGPTPLLAPGPTSPTYLLSPTTPPGPTYHLSPTAPSLPSPVHVPSIPLSPDPVAIRRGPSALERVVAVLHTTLSTTVPEVCSAAGVSVSDLGALLREAGAVLQLAPTARIVHTTRAIVLASMPPVWAPGLRVQEILDCTGLGSYQATILDEVLAGMLQNKTLSRSIGPSGDAIYSRRPVEVHHHSPPERDRGRTCGRDRDRDRDRTRYRGRGRGRERPRSRPYQRPSRARSQTVLEFMRSTHDNLTLDDFTPSGLSRDTVHTELKRQEALGMVRFSKYRGRSFWNLCTKERSGE